MDNSEKLIISLDLLDKNIYSQNKLLKSIKILSTSIILKKSGAHIRCSLYSFIFNFKLQLFIISSTF
ncbi:hypothetical protein HOB94_00605 [bacterium]|nr:hypothetical protein [bacterium]MBT6778682.1 hypothetical protein [bacterium]